jgi:hypothetical protein
LKPFGQQVSAVGIRHESRSPWQVTATWLNRPSASANQNQAFDGIVDAARKYPLEGVKKDEIDKALHYFEANAPRMRYHWFRDRGLFVGSGVVEAACKSVIGQRMQSEDDLGYLQN